LECHLINQEEAEEDEAKESMAFLNIEWPENQLSGPDGLAKIGVKNAEGLGMQTQVF
jgi:hypothetical protein